MRDLDKFSFAKSCEICCTTVAHTCSQTSDQLKYNLCESTLIRYLSHNSFRHELLDVFFHILKISILGALLHCLERTHAAIGFKLATIENNCLSGRLFYSCKKRPCHNGVCTGSKCLNDIS